MRMTKKLLFFLTLFCGTLAFAEKNEKELAVHLLSYLAQDYGEAVQEGRVISKPEYQEQVDFITEVLRISDTNNFDADIENDIFELNKSILNKAKVEEVSRSATELKSKILERYELLTYPVTELNLQRAEVLYKNNCMQCHGVQGYGDGEAGVGLDPAPTDFHDLERMHNVSPYGAFNTITLGVEGTGMASHDYLSKEDRWSLAYYVSSLRFKGAEKNPILKLSIQESSSLSDNEIKETYSIKDDDFLSVLASVRDINSSFSENTQGQLGLHLTKAISDLKSSFDLYKSGKIDEAKNLSLTAYLKGIEPVEGIIHTKDSGAVIKLEGDLSRYRSLLGNEASINDVKSSLSGVIGQLEKLKRTVEISKTASTSFLMSFGIVLREAFEAGLILFLLLGLTRKSKATVFNKNIHFGWVSSLVIGLLLFVVIERYFVISGKFAESIEGYTALIASAMLFFVGYWLHKNTNISKIKNRMLSAVEGSMNSGRGLALFFVAFTACFREVFETILFLKIIILDGHRSFYVASGALFAIILATTAISLAVKYSVKLNLKYMFRASTVLILGLSIVFLGKGIGAFQKTGFLEQTIITNFSAPSFGFNSTLEVMIAQISVLLIIACYIALSYRFNRVGKVV